MSSFKNQKNSELQCFKFIKSQFKQRGYPYLGRMMFGKPPAIFDGTGNAHRGAVAGAYGLAVSAARI